MQRDTNLELELEVGTYGLYCEVDWFNICYVERNFAVSRYGPGLDNFDDITSKMSKFRVLKEVYLSAIERDSEVYQCTMDEHGAPDIVFKQLIDQTMYHVYVVQNNDDSLTYNGTIEFGEQPIGLTVLPPY